MIKPIKSKVELVFDSARGIVGYVTIGVRLFQKSDDEKMFFIRTYSCEYEEDGETKIATLEDKSKYMAIEDINQLATIIDAKSRMSNENFIQSFEDVMSLGLLAQTQKECREAEAKGKIVNFGSKAEDWEILVINN